MTSILQHPPVSDSGSASSVKASSGPRVPITFVAVATILVGFGVYRSLSPDVAQIAPAAEQVYATNEGAEAPAVETDSFGPAETLPHHQQCDEAGNCEEVWIFGDSETGQA